MTRPEASTVATCGLLEAHVTGRPVNTPPFASRRAAVAWTTAPRTTEAEGNVTVIDAIGTGRTVNAAVPVTFSLIALMVALPGVSVVTSPLDATVATAGLLELHAMARPVSSTPCASRVAAENCCGVDTITDAVNGVTTTAATGMGLAGESQAAIAASRSKLQRTRGMAFIDLLTECPRAAIRPHLSA